MNQEQVKSAVRWFVATFGGVIAGWFAAKGWFTVDQVTTVLNSPATLAFIASVVPLVWGMFVHTESNAVAVVDTLAKKEGSPVKAVVMEPTPAGRELAGSLPGKTTVVAGSSEAVVMSRAA